MRDFESKRSVNTGQNVRLFWNNGKRTRHREKDKQETEVEKRGDGSLQEIERDSDRSQCVIVRAK